MPNKANETLNDVIVIPVTCNIYGQAIEFGLNDQMWDDGSYLFYGYKGQGTLPFFSQSVNLLVEISPKGTPERTNPFLHPSHLPSKNVTWYENAVGILADAFVFLREFEEKRAFLFDGTLNAEVEKHYDAARFADAIDLFGFIVKNNRISFQEKISQLVPVLLELRDILDTTYIPHHLKYEESLFYLNLLPLEEHIERLILFAENSQQEVDHAFMNIARELSLVIVAIHNDHQDAARGRRVMPTIEQKDFILEVLDELAHIATLPPDSPEAMLYIGRKLELYRLIWNNSYVDWQTRLDCATEAVNLISDAISRIETATIESKKRHAKIPSLNQYTKEINHQLQLLEKTSFSDIETSLAEKFLPKLNTSRKIAGKTHNVTKEEFISTLHLDSMHLMVSEQENQLLTTIRLELSCKEYSFAAHKMNIFISNGRIQDIKLATP